jgi:hypothetical protein
MSLVVLFLAEAVKTTLAEPPFVRVTLEELNDMVGGWSAVGVSAVESDTVPTKPFTLVTIIVELPVSPFRTPISVFEALVPIVKVGIGVGV